MTLIRGISGLRGIVGKGLDDNVISKHVTAFSKLQKSGSILLARDSRTHGDSFLNLAHNTLKLSKREILNYGVIPTPTAQFIIEKNNLAGGIVITASHNPTEWNGLKFIDSNGCFLNGEQNNKLFNLADKLPLIDIKNNTNHPIKRGYKEHIDHTLNLSIIDLKTIKNRNFSVVVDAVNGAAAFALPDMLEALGCNVHRLFCEPTGVFERGAEPLANNLNKLSNAVQLYGADLGVATDPDGDRLAIVDEKGVPISEEYTLVICADGFFNTTKFTEPIVTNLSSTLALDKIAKNHGSYVCRSEVGEINVVNKMKELRASFGGEGNGGVILPESHYGRDSLVAATLILNRMAQTSESISKIFNSMPQYSMIKDKVSLGSIEPQNAINKIESKFPHLEKNKLDGLKLIWENSWCHIRKSNTEPIIRIYVEAPSNNEALKIMEKIKSCINEV